jgi:hypothetical protein
MPPPLEGLNPPRFHQRAPGEAVVVLYDVAGPLAPRLEGDRNILDDDIEEPFLVD